MDTLSAVMMGMANKGKELKVFDWDKAARLILENGCQEAEAGLVEDWFWTGASIFAEGKPTPDDNAHAYLASNWATPVLRIGENSHDCYKMQSETPGWDSDTHWPESALKILEAAA